MDNFKEYGVEVSDVKMVLPQMMKQKDTAVAGLTSGIEGLFKKNKVIHCTASICKQIVSNVKIAVQQYFTLHLANLLSFAGHICQGMGVVQRSQ